MENMIKWPWRVALQAAAMCGLLSCGAEQRPPGGSAADNAPQIQAPEAPPPAEAASGLPDLRFLPPVRQARELVFTAQVLSVPPVLTSAQGVAASAGSLTLAPPAGGLAWAIYSQPGYPADGSILPYSLDHNASAGCWLGLSDFSQGRWDLLPLSPPAQDSPEGVATLDVPGGNGLKSADGTVYLAFIAWGSPVSLDLVDLVSREARYPDPPQLLSASRWQYEDRIELRWARPAMAESYLVYRDTTFAPIATLGNVGSYADYGVGDLLGHNYWVVASNADGLSPASNVLRGYRRPATPDHPFSGWIGEWGSAQNSLLSLVPGPVVEAETVAEMAVPAGPLAEGLAVSSDGMVYVTPAAGQAVYGFKADGEEAWESPLGGNSNCLSLGGEQVYVAYFDMASQRPQVAALDRHTGSAQWQYAPYASVVAIRPWPGGLYLFLSGGIFVSLNLEGEEQWLLADSAASEPPAVGTAGELYFFGSGELAGEAYLRGYSAEREALFETPLLFHTPINPPLLSRDGMVLVQIQPKTGATELLKASVASFTPEGEIDWDFESAEDYAAGLAEDPGGFLSFAATNANGATAFYRLAPNGSLVWSELVEHSVSDFYADGTGKVFCLASSHVTVLDQQGNEDVLLDSDGNLASAGSFLIPAGPYRLLTAGGAGLKMLGQGL